MGGYDSQGVPDYLEEADNLEEDFLNRIDASLPENYPVPSYNPDYISTSAETNIVLQQEADIWVTFVAEGAGYKNTLGYYLFDPSLPPSTVPEASDINIIFPNVSLLNSGGGLLPGDKVHLGSFPQGTGIGWVLIANGWDEQQQIVVNKQWTLFSEPFYNPELDNSLKFHNVLLIDELTDRIVLGFEDIRRDYNSCDNDFNDAIFYITANPIESIILNDINFTTDVEGNISSGNQGGLESEGSLAEKIAQRTLNRNLIKNDPNRYLETSMDAFVQANRLSFDGNALSLSSLVPDIGPDSTSSFLSTPMDLLDLTNAEDVLSVDYFKDSKRHAACLVTRTIENVYSHTKSICDRVSGAELLATKNISINGEYPATLISIRRPNEGTEYAISFSIRVRRDSVYEYTSHWNIDNYPSGGEYYNFQLWGNKPANVFYLAEEIIDEFQSSFQMTENISYSVPPDILMGYGEYVQGRFKMKLLNKKRKPEILHLTGTIRNAEGMTSVPYSQIIKLNGAATEYVEFETPGVFDAGLEIIVEGSNDKESIYLADGAWIANFEENNATDIALEIFPTDSIIDNAQEYIVERSLKSSGNVKNYVSFHRPLRLGLRPVDLSNYKNMSFVASGTDEVEIVISHKRIINWSDQPRKIIELTNDAKRYDIPMEEFVSSNGTTEFNDDISSITFSVKGDHNNFHFFEMEINNLSFNNNKGCPLNKEVVSTSYSSEIYNSMNSLKASNKVVHNSEVQYNSENSIDFVPGFCVELGAEIKAQIKGCDN